MRQNGSYSVNPRRRRWLRLDSIGIILFVVSALGFGGIAVARGVLGGAGNLAANPRPVADVAQVQSLDAQRVTPLDPTAPAASAQAEAPQPTPIPPTLAPPTPAPTATLPIIAIDPGHGGREPGSVHRGPDGRVDLLEKDANLKIALRLSALLADRGFRTVLTRSTDSEVNVPPRDLNGDGKIDPDDDLQARVDIANEAGADMLFSIHNNGLSDPRVRGTHTYYAIAHPQGSRGAVLAALLQESLIKRLHSVGYADAVNGGFHDDSGLGKPFGHLFLTGPKTPRVARVSQMSGVVGESLFVSNDREASLLKNDDVIDAIAHAYLDAAIAFVATE